MYGRSFRPRLHGFFVFPNRGQGGFAAHCAPVGKISHKEEIKMSFDSEKFAAGVQRFAEGLNRTVENKYRNMKRDLMKAPAEQVIRMARNGNSIARNTSISGRYG